jgi:hypothetical protein
MGSSRRSLDAMPVKCKVLRCRRLYLSATDPARLGLADSDCVFRCFVKGSSRIVLGIHGSDFPGSEIGCFEPGNVFWREPHAAAAYHQLLAICILLVIKLVLNKKLPFPALIREGQLKTRHAPGTSFELTRSRSWPIQRKSSTTDSGISKPSRAPTPSTPPPALSYPSTFPTPSALWTNPGNQATSARPTELSAATSSNPKTRPTTSS